MEAQYRGAPHFHIILQTEAPQKRRKLAAWLAASWCHIRGQQGPEMEQQSVDVRDLESGADAENSAKRLGAYLTAGGAPWESGKCWDKFGGKK